MHIYIYRDTYIYRHMNNIKYTITHIHPHTVYIYIMHTCTTMFSCTTMYTSIPKFPLSQTFEHCPFFGPLSQAWLDFQSPLDAPWVHRMGGKIWLYKTWHWNLWNNPVYLSRIIHTWKICSISFLAEYPATFRFFMSLSFHILYICTYVYKYTYSLIALNWTIGGIHSEIQIFGLKRLQGNGYGEWFIFDENNGARSWWSWSSAAPSPMGYLLTKIDGMYFWGME